MLKYLDEYRDAKTVGIISEDIKRLSTKPFNIMEVCGGHTISIRKNGIQNLIGDNINLISGPGCPVCVTAISDIDKAIALADLKGTMVCTFGDLMYVPGTISSLADAKTEGSDVRTVYSVYDAIVTASNYPDKKVVFISIGFETTTPTIAAAIKQARMEKIDNFSVLVLNKTMPEALNAVLRDKDSKIEGLICPGHVSTIAGVDMYRPIVEDLEVSCCVSGFEPVDILRSVYVLTNLYERGKSGLVNAYERAVKEEGNQKARNIMDEVFEPADTEWRGFGIIPSSGLAMKKEYEEFDAEKIFDIDVPESEENKDCICGDILRGAKSPEDCPLFKSGCTPENPQGACMVSSEGTCAAWYRYGA